MSAESEERDERPPGEWVDDRFDLDDLEPGDSSEEFSPLDWCLVAGCGCGGCLDPIGCLDAASQGCLGCFEACLAKIGCGALVLGGLIWGVVSVFSVFSSG